MATAAAGKTHTVKVTQGFLDYQRPLSWWEKFYIREIIGGFFITMGHFFPNVLKHIFTGKSGVTIQYPEERKWVSHRWRSRHRLTTRPDGRITCVACFMCANNCPANCIHIEAGELPQPYETNRQKIDKFPVSFKIDLGVCIYCGMCVEACPEDAIRMDTGLIATVAYTREQMMIDKVDLVNPAPSKHEIVYNDVWTPPEERLPAINARRIQPAPPAAG